MSDKTPQLSAEQYLGGILLRYGHIEEIQKEINELVVKAREAEEYEDYKESIESYYER